MRALKAGARAYLLKDSAAADLISAIEAVSQGKSFFSPKVSRILAEDYVRVLKKERVRTWGRQKVRPFCVCA